MLSQPLSKPVTKNIPIASLRDCEWEIYYLEMIFVYLFQISPKFVSISLRVSIHKFRELLDAK